MSTSKTYRRRYDDVQAFVTALSRFLEVCESTGPDYFGVSNPVWTPKAGQEAEASRRAAQVDRVAGRAAQALGHEFFIEWKPRGTFQTQPVSPATAWRTIIDHDPAFTVDVIFAVCNQALGVLEARATDAEERERSLAGKVERVTGRTEQTTVRGEGHLRPAITSALLGIPAALVVAFLAHHFGWV